MRSKSNNPKKVDQDQQDQWPGQPLKNLMSELLNLKHFR